MSEPIYFDEEFKKQWRYALEQARADREKYYHWIKDEIEKAVKLINSYDKIFVLGGLGARLLQSSPNFYNQFMEVYAVDDKEQIEQEKILEDDEIEVLLEYAMSIAFAGENKNAGVKPTQSEIDEIREQLSKIKFNVGFYERSAENPPGGTEFDHWLKLQVMEDALNVRGDGYHIHIQEVYKETFAPHDGFLNEYYGFTSSDVLEVVERLDVLVASKIANPFGAKLAHDRIFKTDEIRDIENEQDEQKKTRRMFESLFGIKKGNEDLYPSRNREGAKSFQLSPTLIRFDEIAEYKRLFWVIPENEKHRKIFNLLSHQFGDNDLFLRGKFGGFPLGDTLVKTKPLVKVDDKYFYFSINLAFRNIFEITSNLLQTADSIYYEQQFRGNTSPISRDNYIELKTKRLFERFLPTVRFYHSLKYSVVEDGLSKKTELDILGVGKDALYIIEVKSGELNKKHRRGAILGLKDRLKETVNEGSYQCYRAEKYIADSDAPDFRYTENNQGKILSIDKTKNYETIKISVTYEHLASVSVNLKYLIESGVLSEAYKWTWIVSLYDLMIFSDMIEHESDFKEYLQYRLGLYERNDIEFNDEIDILGYFFENLFPLKEEKKNERIMMLSYKQDFETYYTRKGVGMPNVVKPRRKAE